ncbi:MAG: Asp-tRNA(Asn)/Glu-tRNA(Gln) amidotransferase subunit GatC [Nanoarchaeota archaeon]
MKIDKELIERVAKVSRLNLKEEEKESFVKDFKDVLEVFSKIGKVKTDNLDLSVQPVKFENVFREDKVEKSLNEKEVFKNTELKEKGFFKGPKIL